MYANTNTSEGLQASCKYAMNIKLPDRLITFTNIFFAYRKDTLITKFLMEATE